MKVIYKPQGRAKEYSEYALNIGIGCIHGCKYCYAPGLMRMKKDDYHLEFKPRKNLLENLEKDLIELKKMQNEKPVLLSFITDPYQNMETMGLTRKCLELFRVFNIPFSVLTKGGEGWQQAT
jgi:DNA repair photolyase